MVKGDSSFLFFASIISNKFSEKTKLTQYPLQHSSSFVQLLYVVYVKSSDKLLNQLMLVQALTEVKFEVLKIKIFFLGEIS